MNIFIADRHVATRSALKILLTAEADITIVGEADNQEDLLTQVAATRPNIILLDWELSGTDVNLLPALHALNVPYKLIALSGRPEARQEALAAGVDAFVSKGDSPARLLTTLRAVQL